MKKGVVTEIWRPIEGFPLYEVSNLGRIANIRTDFLLNPSLNKQGVLKVGLSDGDRQHTRSVKVIVARTFVDGRDDIFDTPILLDGEPTHCEAANIRWRPRWFAWHYAHQFLEMPEYYGMGPLVDVGSKQEYKDLVDAGTTHGLLFEDIWKALHTKQSVFPTGQTFAWSDKI